VAISKITDTNERSTFTGATIAIGVIFGLGLSPFLLGLAADKWSFHAGIFILGALTVISCTLIGKIKKI
jgi:MFS family permease